MREDWGQSLSRLLLGLLHRSYQGRAGGFDAAEELNDWACLAIHHLYRPIWSLVEEDPRYRELVRRAYASHQLEPR